VKSLFSQENSKCYLSVLYNDEAYQEDITNLFDAKKFDKLLICTFVSSPKFFFKQTQAFNHIELLLGIEDSQNAQKYLFDPKYTDDFFKSLDKTILEKITTDNIAIRFTTVGTTIHSKIYIQQDTKTQEARVMIGSANYSATAFGNKKQYEELLVYDSTYNKKLTDYYLQRYEDIKAETLDFIPKRIKKKIKTQELKILTLDSEESLEILKERIDDIQSVAIVADELDENLILNI